MEAGSYFDVAQITLYVFWLFFAGLIFHLIRENKREGYPLESDRSDRIEVVGFPRPPSPKTFLLRDGSKVTVPREESHANLNAAPAEGWPGAPLVPLGDPMVDGVGPAASPHRADVPDLTFDDHVKIVPLRVAPEFRLNERDPDPRGYPVVGADGQQGGVISDVWVDRSEMLIRYFEVAVESPEGRRAVLLPYNFANVDSRGRVTVPAVLGEHFTKVPVTSHPDEVTLNEEDRIAAFYAGGLLYALPERSEPFI